MIHEEVSHCGVEIVESLFASCAYVIWLPRGPILPVDVNWIRLRRETEAIVGMGMGFPGREFGGYGFSE